MLGKILVVANPISGKNRTRQKTIDFVSGYVREHCETMTVQLTSGRGDATALARNAVSSGYDLVVAIGGDGTVNEVATGLVHTEVPMAVIPAGSGNGFARSLGIPMAVEQASSSLLRSRVTAIDVGKLNERLFFMIAGVGFDAAVGKSFEEYHRRGPFAYFYLAAREFFRYRPQSMSICINGKTSTSTPFMVAVANAQQYGNDARIAPKARMNDGLLNVVIIHSLSLYGVFAVTPRLFWGNIENLSNVSTYETDAISIQRDRGSFVNIDGEVCEEETELRINILPRALKVLAPTNSQALCR